MTFTILTSDGNVWFVTDFASKKELIEVINKWNNIEAYKTTSSQSGWTVFTRNIVACRQWDN